MMYLSENLKKYRGITELSRSMVVSTIDSVIINSAKEVEVCFKFGDILFTGDTLFLRSVGRSDLPTGDQDQLQKSIKEKIYCLDENIIILPGHGRQSSIGYEKKYNLFVRS